MSTMDFRNQEPVWVRYAINVAPGHDKYYEVRVDFSDEGMFILTKRWGARPDAGGGQIKVEEYQTLPGAIGVGSRRRDTEIARGCRACERPDGASNKVRREYGPDFYDEEI